MKPHKANGHTVIMDYFGRFGKMDLLWPYVTTHEDNKHLQPKPSNLRNGHAAASGPAEASGAPAAKNHRRYPGDRLLDPALYCSLSSEVRRCGESRALTVLPVSKYIAGRITFERADDQGLGGKLTADKALCMHFESTSCMCSLHRNIITRRWVNTYAVSELQ